MVAPARERRCRDCGTAFLAYRRGVACPGCGTEAAERVPIVEAILKAYEDNLRTHGSAVPPTFRVRDLWDDYVYRGLFFLRAYDARGPRDTAETVIERLMQVPDGALARGWRPHYADFYRELLRARRRPSEREK